MYNIPTIDECLELMDSYGMPDHIKAHSLGVRDVSVFLADELNKKGESLDVKLVEASALLHDIAKIHCVKCEKRHDHEGARILRSKGYFKIANIVEQHVNLWYEDRVGIYEEDVINYADKRIMHDKLVTLDERFVDLRVRYAVELDKILITEKKSYDLEKKIFKNLDFSPNELINLIK